MRLTAYRELLALAEALALPAEPGRRGDPRLALEPVGLRLHRFAPYDCTPVGAHVFASTGGDGVHFSLLPVPGREHDPPVVMTVPMNLGGPHNFVVGESLVDFLALGCRYGYFALEQLAYDWDSTVKEIERSSLVSPDWHDDTHQAILAALTARFSLTPWQDVGARLKDLEQRFMPFVVEEDDAAREDEADVEAAPDDAASPQTLDMPEAENYWDHPTIDLDDDVWWIFPPHPARAPVRLSDVLQPFAARSFVLVDHSTPLDARDGASAHVHDPLNDVHVSLISEGSGYFYVGVQAEPLLRGDAATARRHADVLLEAGKLCIERLRPAYAYVGCIAGVGDLPPDPEDVAAGRLTHLYWAQYFGPDLTHALTRELLAEAPGWRNENVAGGILYCLSASPYGRGDPRTWWPAARTYFAERYPQPITFCQPGEVAD